MVRRFVFVSICALGLVLGSAGVAGAAVGAQGGRRPSVSPVTGGLGVPVVFGTTTFDLASVGYTQSEHFLSGTAAEYSPTKALTSDGRWDVSVASRAQYKTRIVVQRPAKARDFNGTVFVEWFNDSGLADANPDWVQSHAELIREGYAWVGVSAQALGQFTLKLPPNPTPWVGDPARYGSLSHPGDAYSYDIFKQAGEAVRDDSKAVMGGLRPKRVLAIGESQSAGWLTSFINGVQPRTHTFDGFLVHSRGGFASPIGDSWPPTPVFIRDDLDVPVLQFETETDLTQLGFVAARQADTDRLRTWEVAGTSHYDLYGLQTGLTDIGDRAGAAAWFDSMLHPTNQPHPLITCGRPINTGPQSLVLRAAVHALDRWVAKGTLPPVSPRIETTPGPSPQIKRDVNGIAIGGIRTPAVDAPVAIITGGGQTGLGQGLGLFFCNIFGSTTPLNAQQLAGTLRRSCRVHASVEGVNPRRRPQRVHPPTRRREPHRRRRPWRAPPLRPSATHGDGPRSGLEVQVIERSTEVTESSSHAVRLRHLHRRQHDLEVGLDESVGLFEQHRPVGGHRVDDAPTILRVMVALEQAPLDQDVQRAADDLLLHCPPARDLRRCSRLPRTEGQRPVLHGSEIELCQGDVDEPSERHRNSMRSSKRPVHIATHRVIQPSY